MRVLAAMAAVATVGLAACASPRVDATRELFPHPLDPSRQIEVYWRKPDGPGPFPLLVFVHGHQPGLSTIGGRAYADWGALQGANALGAVGLAVSQPGYGASDGPADFCGPFTQAAVRAAIDHFRALPFVDPARVVLEGTSRGAMVAGMVATQDPRLAGAILIAGAYDLGALREQGFGGISRWNFLREAGRATPEVLAARSAQSHLDDLRVPVLLLHGAHDDKLPVAQAEQFAAALRSRGKDVELHVFPDAGHLVPFPDRWPFQRSFLLRVAHLGPPIPPPR